MFCGILSLFALRMALYAPSPPACAPLFFCFLPMCFVFVGSAPANMQREIRELRAQLSAQAGANP